MYHHKHDKIYRNDYFKTVKTHCSRHAITEILLKVALSTIKQTNILSVYAIILVFYAVVRVCVVVWRYFVLILFLLCVFSLFFVWLFM
jgi:hypothetical protein